MPGAGAGLGVFAPQTLPPRWKLTKPAYSAQFIYLAVGHNYMKKILLIISLNLFCWNLPITTAKDNMRNSDVNIDSKEKNESSYYGEKILFYSKEILTLLGLVLGIGIGVPILSRKLREQQFSQIVNDIYISNKSVKSEILPLIDEAITKTYENNIVTKKEIIEVQEKLQQIQKEAINSSSQVITLLFLTKKLLQIIENDYNDKGTTILITSRELYGLIINLLYEIDFFATNIVNIKAFKFRDLVYAKKALRPYCNDYKFKVFKNPPQGLYVSLNSIITLRFIQEAINSKNNLICRSAFKIIGNSSPIARHLLLSQIYFPVVLKEVKDEERPFGILSLNLISFKFMTRYTTNENTKSIVSLSYSNINSFLNFTKSIKIDELKNHYIDDYLGVNWSEFAEFQNIKYNEPELITIEIEESILKKFYNKYSGILKAKMKSELRPKKE